MDAQTTLTLRCTACGALAQASCKCGATYAYISPGELAARGIKDDPDKSNRAIADKWGIDEGTVRNARKATAENSAVKRTGRDGKTRRMPKKRPARHDAMVEMKDRGHSKPEISEAIGVGARQVDMVLQREEMMREAIARAEPEINAKLLSMSAQQKLNAAIRQHKRKLDLEYDTRRMNEIREHIKKIMPTLQEDKNRAFRAEQTYREFMQKQKKIMTIADFTLVLSCLHPDSRASVSEERLKRAFQIVQPKKFALTGER